MAGFKSFDYGNEGLEMVAQGIPAAINAYYDSKNQAAKERELAAKQKAEERKTARDEAMDRMKLSEAGYDIQGAEDPIGLMNRGLLKKREGFVSDKDLNRTVKQAQLAMMNQRMASAQKEKTMGKQLPPDKVLKVQEGAMIPNMLSDIKSTIEKNKARFGPIKGRASSYNPYDTEAQTIDAQMRASSQAFGRYMEGGVLRKEDEEKYRKMFPSLSDTPAVAESKLAIVNRMLSKKQNADVKALRDSGYDVGSFQDLPEGELPKSLNNNPVDVKAISIKDVDNMSEDELDRYLEALGG